MNAAVLHLRIVSKRMLTLQEAAQHCGRSVKRFEIECPAPPVIFPNGDRRFDVHDLDKWLDSYKRGVRIRDKAADGGKRRFGNYVKAVLSFLFGWGVERGHVSLNPAKGLKNIRKRKGMPAPNRPWMDSERHAVLDEAPAHMLPALALMAFTGLGPGDALRLPKTFYKEGAIATSRSKTGEPVYWPAPAPLRTILKNAPKHDAITLCANSDGKPWTVSGFRASWRKVRLKLEAEQRVNSGL